MHETSWVRSIYLYLMCVVSFALVALGSLGAIGGLVHTVAPDLGHRDTIDRIGIGLSNVASSVVNLVDQAQGSNAESFCRDSTVGNSEFDACMKDQSSSSDQMSAIQDGIGEVKSELQHQIRSSSIDQMIRGLLLVGAGLLLFRIHGKRTELFADGLLPVETAAAPPAADTATIPPPPPAPAV